MAHLWQLRRRGTNLIGNMEIEPDGSMFAYSNGGEILNPSLQAISFPLSS